MDSTRAPSWKRRRIGERLGRYVLGPSIGAGGAASVYLARLDGPLGFERLLAIKIVHEHLLEDKDFMAMFLDEANLAVRLSHPNIVHTYELGHQGEVLFLAMEYLRGRPLSLVYQRAFEQGAPLEYELISWLGARCADALHYAHELRDEQGVPLKVVHRDISPDNLFLTYDGEVKLIDFGIARAEGRLAQTDIGSVKGKFRYMSPEYALGRSFDHTLDLFALGASLYEAALGRAAFEGADAVRTVERLVLGDVPDPLRLRPDFPPELARILSRAMNSARALRYESGGEMAAELDRQAGLTATEARARLAARMRALHSRELARESAVVAEVRGLRPTPVGQGATPLHHEILARSPERRPRWVLGAALMAAGATVALPLWLAQTGAVRGEAQPAPAASLTGLSPAARPEPAPSSSPNPSPPAISASASDRVAPGPLLVTSGAAATRGSPPRSPNVARQAEATSGLANAAKTATPVARDQPGGVIRANPFAGDP